MDQAIDGLIRLAQGEGGCASPARIAAYRLALAPSAASGPWNTAFCAWLLQQWLQHHAPPSLAATLRPCHEPQAFAWEAWARQQGLQVVGAEQQARRGDLAVFALPHLGLVVEDQLHPAAPVHTLEADTLDEQGRNGIWPQQRAPHLLRCYLRFIWR